MHKLTPAEKRLYDALDEFQRANKYTPSVRTLGVILNRDFSGIHRQLNALISKNVAKRVNNRHIELMPLS